MRSDTTDVVILDLEWNAAYSRRLGGYINEIIEFGAVKCGSDLTSHSSFSCLVRPALSKRMNSYTADLTNLSLDQLDSGLSFMAAVSRFKKWAGDCLLLTWGTSDILTLIENCRYFGGSERIPFLSRYCDAQRYAQERLGTGTAEQLGLGRAAELLAIDLTGREQHRALDDSLITLEILKRIGGGEELAARGELCDEEFYRKMTFKNHYITDLSDPAVKREYLRFSCPACGGETKRTERWSQRSRSLKADFRCKSCGLAFSGRVTLKQKYDGLSVTKKAVPLPVVETPEAPPAGSLEHMRLEEREGVRVLRFPEWEGLPGLNAAFSTRLGGVSEGEFASMNLGFNRGDEEEKVAENVRRFCAGAGFDPESLVCGAQDHHLNIRRVDRSHRGLGFWREMDVESVDGLCTDDPAVTLAVYCADCVPLYFYDEEHRAIGLAHAGWRGTAGGMAAEMLRRMAEEFGSRPERLRVAIGPSISRESFEVDEPCAAVFLKLPEAEQFVFGPVTNGAGEEKYHVDLWECNRRFLLRGGVPPERITVGGVDTFRHSRLIFSHRRTRGKRGSNCALLSLTDKE